VRLCCGKIRVLFLPRLTPEISQQLLSKTPDGLLDAEVLVMPLGGSELLSAQAVIHKVSPKYLVSSVNQFSRVGVPSSEWEYLLAQRKIVYLRQDKTGAVMIDADPKQMIVEPYVPQTDHVEADRSGAR
jgi:beta-lactamase superfamily II metal-dependent hydrolase